MPVVLEGVRVRQQARREQAHISTGMSIACRAHQPLKVRRFREPDAQLAAIALSRRPLVTECVRRHGRLVIRSQQIQKAQHQERSLAQAHRRRGR